MIRIGILSGDNSSTESIKLIQQFRDFKITGIAQNDDSQNIKNQQYTIEDLASNSDATYFNIENLPIELIQMGIKKSNHLFLKKLPDIQLNEIRLLNNLVSEAGSNILLYNPFLFQTEILGFQNHLKTPHLINMRLPLKNTELENQLLDSLLFLISTEHCECKKVDVFAFKGVQRSSLIHIHLLFSNGCLAQIHLGESFKPDQASLEVFQKDNKYTSLPIKQPVGKDIEKNALDQFIRAILNKPAISVSLNELEPTVILVDEIKKKLNHLGYLPMN